MPHRLSFPRCLQSRERRRRRDGLLLPVPPRIGASRGRPARPSQEALEVDRLEDDAVVSAAQAAHVSQSRSMARVARGWDRVSLGAGAHEVVRGSEGWGRRRATLATGHASPSSSDGARGRAGTSSPRSFSSSPTGETEDEADLRRAFPDEGVPACLDVARCLFLEPTHERPYDGPHDTGGRHRRLSGDGHAS